MKAYQWIAGAAGLSLAAVVALPLACDKVRATRVEYRQTVVVPPPTMAVLPPSYVAPAPASDVQPIPPPPRDAAPSFVVETRGPVHEAFAEPLQYQPEAGIVINQAPPEAIREVPPAERPADPRAIWIPGYWGWDDDRSDFIWVSGVWRVSPPDCTWVSGYWARTTQGFQWVPGYWAQTADQVVEYLPAPPAPVEIGPVGAAPSADVVWVSGSWEWSTTRYLWRPGQWIPARADWVWTPAHYIWTPRGYIYVPGHWDYALERRGMVFAPVYFGRTVILQEGFTYQPAMVIDTGAMVITLFARPTYSHYYFGDYYDVAYVRMGIYPWYVSYTEHRWNDPLYGQERWRHLRDDPRWDDHQRQEYDRRVRDVGARPPRSIADQQAWQRTHPQPTAAQRQMVIAQPLKDLATARNPTVKLEPVTQQQRRDIEQRVQDVGRERIERSKIESAAPPATRPERLPRPGIAPRTTAPETTRPEVATPPTKRPEVVTPPTKRPEVVAPPTRRPEVVTPPTKRPEVVTPTPETRRPEVVTPPTKRPEVVTPTPETRRPEMVTPPTKRPEVVTPTPETRRPEVVTPPTKRPEVVTPTPETRRPEVVTPPTKRPEVVTPTPETRRPEVVAPPETRRPEVVAPPETRRPEPPAPREVTRPEPPAPREVTRPEPPTPRETVRPSPSDSPRSSPSDTRGTDDNSKDTGKGRPGRG